VFLVECFWADVSGQATIIWIVSSFNSGNPIEMPLYFGESTKMDLAG